MSRKQPLRAWFKAGDIVCRNDDIIEPEVLRVVRVFVETEMVQVKVIMTRGYHPYHGDAAPFWIRVSELRLFTAEDQRVRLKAEYETNETRLERGAKYLRTVSK